MSNAAENLAQDTPRWVTNGGMTQDDWHVLGQYIYYLSLLEEATHRLQGRGKSQRFGAAWEVIPTCESILNIYEREKVALAKADYEADNMFEDYYKININLAWDKINKYWTKVDNCPAYYAACRLHPYYKDFTNVAWKDRPDWIGAMDRKFLDLWAPYRDEGRPPTPQAPQPSKKRSQLDNYSQIQDMIDATLRGRGAIPIREDDELERWERLQMAEPGSEYFYNPFQFWDVHKHEFPRLYKLAIDVLSIPASSADCERMFSELGDMLEPRRERMLPQLVTALQYSRHWAKRPWIGAGALVGDREVENLMQQIDAQDD